LEDGSVLGEENDAASVEELVLKLKVKLFPRAAAHYGSTLP
jgi:hypothetical protein